MSLFSVRFTLRPLCRLISRCDRVLIYALPFAVYVPRPPLIGGMNALAASLALHLHPLDGEPLVAHLRIVDKFSMFPPTTHVLSDFLKLLKEREGAVEYRQANLTVASTVSKCFTDPAPNGQPYTHIFDLTGESTHDRPAEVQIAQTFSVSLLIGKEAAKHSIKAYVRSLSSYYDHDTEKKSYTEDDPDGWTPLGVRGTWWHESVRALASIPNLPLVVIRKAYVYGPGVPRGDVTTCILLGLVYKHLGEEMKFLWGPKLKKNTLYSQDAVRAGWMCSQWAASMTRDQANAAAGVLIPPSGDKSVTSVPDVVAPTETVIAPVFNLTDDGDTDQDLLGQVIAQYFDIKSGFHGAITMQLAKLKFDDMVEEVNELHTSKWTEIITQASPPVPSTPLSPYAPRYQLERRGCALNGQKLKEIVGYTPKYPRFSVETVKETIDSWKAEGIWPQT
ncbi:hypothetical protein FRC16_004646 [Serendipita sp. 398]|nr:hypothetical protein FRC16_004646 [Serendipita sp. 398]